MIRAIEKKLCVLSALIFRLIFSEIQEHLRKSSFSMKFVSMYFTFTIYKIKSVKKKTVKDITLGLFTRYHITMKNII